MPHEEPMPPLDAILDGSGVRYYSRRTRQLTSLEKKLEAAREVLQAARKEQGRPNAPKLFPSDGSPPSRSNATAGVTPLKPMSSAALRLELRRQAVQSGGCGGSAGGDETTAATAGCGGGGATSSPTSRSRSGLDSDFQHFADALVGSGRGPVVQSKPYHTEARTYLHLSLLPSSVTRLAADSGLYYSPAGTTRGAPGPSAKGLRESMLKYYQPDLALEREERERVTQMELAVRLAKSQEALSEHIQGLAARWGPGFLERLTVAVAAEAAGETGRASCASGASITSLAAAAAAAAAAAGGGGTGGRRESPLKLHLSGAGTDRGSSGADADYHAGHKGAAGARPRRITSPQPLSSTYSRLYGVSQMYVTAATMERLSYLSEQLKVPVEQIMMLLRKPGSAGDGRASSTGISGARRSSIAPMGSGGARPSRRIELRRSVDLPTHGSMTAPPTSARLSDRPSKSVLVVEADQTEEAPDVQREGMRGRISPFEKATFAVEEGEAKDGDGSTAAVLGMGASSSERISLSFGATIATGPARARSSRWESLNNGNVGRNNDKAERGRQRFTHLVVAAVAERVAAEARTEDTVGAARLGTLRLSGTTATGWSASQPSDAYHPPRSQVDWDRLHRTASPPSRPPTAPAPLPSQLPTAQAPLPSQQPSAPQLAPLVLVALAEPAAAAATSADSNGAAGPSAPPLDSATSPVRRLGLCLPFTSGSNTHKVWSAYPSLRAVLQHGSTSGAASISAAPSPNAPCFVIESAIGIGAAATATSLLASAPASPMVYHHPSGLSYVNMGQAMPPGPSLEGLQPEDPRQGELEAASRAALESLARRHGDHHRVARQQHQAHGGMSAASGSGTQRGYGGGGSSSRAGSASTASRPGTSGSMGLGNNGGGGGGGVSLRWKNSRPMSNRAGSVGSGASEQRRITVGGVNSSVADDESGERGEGGAQVVSGPGNGVEDDGDCRTGGASRSAISDPGARSRSARVRSAGSSRYSGRSRVTSGRSRSRASPLSPRSYTTVGAVTAGYLGSSSGLPGNSGEEVILATAGGGVSRLQGGDGAGVTGRGDSSTAGAPVSRKDLRRLSDLAVAVGLGGHPASARQTSSPRSSASACTGLIDSDNDDDGDCEDDDELERDSFEVGQDGDVRGDSCGERLDSRHSTSVSAGGGAVGSGLQLSWELPATATSVAVSKSMSGSLPGRALAPLAPPDTPRRDGEPCSPIPSNTAVASPTALTASAAEATSAAELAVAPAPASSSSYTSPSLSGKEKPTWLLSRITRPDMLRLNPPGLSRHYKLAGSRWNPAAPGALRPGYGTDSDYVAGTYNPHLMERVSEARDTFALIGDEVSVCHESPLQAASKPRSGGALTLSSPVRPSPQPLAHALSQRISELVPAGCSTSGGDGVSLMPACPATLDLSMLTPAGRAAAANARAALAIADVLNPVTRALTNVAALVPGSDLPPPLQALATARGANAHGGHTTIQLPGVPTAAMATAVAQHLAARPGSPRKSLDLTTTSKRSTVVGSGGGSGAVAHTITAATSGDMTTRSSLATAAAATAEAGERVVSRTIRPSQSVWSRAELDEHDILLPLKQHLAAAAAVGTGRRPAAATTTAAAGSTVGGNTTERRVLTAPPAPEPRLWRGNPLDLKAAFPKGEKVYRLVTDVTANARLLHEVEKDITPVEFRNRMRRGVVL